METRSSNRLFIELDSIRTQHSRGWEISVQKSRACNPSVLFVIIIPVGILFPRTQRGIWNMKFDSKWSRKKGIPLNLKQISSIKQSHDRHGYRITHHIQWVSKVSDPSSRAHRLTCISEFFFDLMPQCYHSISKPNITSIISDRYDERNSEVWVQNYNSCENRQQNGKTIGNQWQNHLAPLSLPVWWGVLLCKMIPVVLSSENQVSNNVPSGTQLKWRSEIYWKGENSYKKRMKMHVSLWAREEGVRDFRYSLYVCLPFVQIFSTHRLSSLEPLHVFRRWTHVSFILCTPPHCLFGRRGIFTRRSIIFWRDKWMERCESPFNDPFYGGS